LHCPWGIKIWQIYKEKLMSSHKHKRTVLIIDDDTILCKAVSDYLSGEHIEVLVAHTGADGLDCCYKRSVDVVLLDQKLPDCDGHDLCSEILKHNGNFKIIFITAYPSFQNALHAIKAGAHDYLTKPFELEELSLALERFFRLLDLERVEQVQNFRADKERERTVLIGENGGLAGTRKMIELAASVDSPVLVTGETGTGKNIVARIIHYSGSRRVAPYISINCAALPENLIEAELFGYEKGAFTGADATRKGIFEMADGGTLFLDEIGSMPFHLQSKLLNVLEEKEIRRLGSESIKPVNMRIICATNADIEDAVAGKTFRKDLYYRISVIRIDLPPLRERQEDIPALCSFFLEQMCGARDVELPDSEVRRLKEYSWPGNVRELKNIIERSAIVQGSSVLRPSELLEVSNVQSPPVQMSSKGAMPATLKEVEKYYITHTLKQFSGNCTKAAEVLGISLSTLKRKLKSYRLSCKGTK
jgi:DNA-binding NtrC family response regulator